MKKRMSKLLLLFCAALLLMGLLAGCGEQRKLQKVTVSEVTHSVFYAPQYAAIELGFFEEEGLELELSNGEGADKIDRCAFRQRRYRLCRPRGLYLRLQ